MARPLRLEAEGAVYHVIARGNERKDVFRDQRDRQRYLELLERYRDRFGFRLLAYCLMDNHLHLAVERGPERLSRVMRALQSSYTQWFNRRHGRVGHLFQGRYKAFLVQRDRYLLALIRYIHENPVEAGLVRGPQDYPWSSDRFYRKGAGPEWLDLDVVLRTFGRGRRAAASRYRRFMGEEIEEPYEWVDVRQAVKGDEDFADQALREAGEKTPVKAGLTAEDVASVVADVNGLSLADLLTPSRRRDLSHGRILAAYLARLDAGISVARMAKLFGREDSTLNHGVLRFEGELKRNPNLVKQVARLRRRLRQ